MSMDHFGVLRITGNNALNFLQGQLTCDVREVTATQSRLSAYCTAKGRVLAVFRVILWQQNYYLITTKTILDSTASTLRKYAMLSRVDVSDASNNLALFACSGKEALEFLKNNIENLPQQPYAVTSTPEWLVINVSDKTPRFIFMGHPEALATMQSACAATSLDWQRLDINAGIPNIYPATQELFTPHMLNLDTLGAVSLSKGCYIGQEVIARTHYLGKSKRRMLHVEFNDAVSAEPGSEIKNGDAQVVGNLVDAVRYEDRYCGLAVLSEELINTISSMKIEEIGY